MPNHQANVIHSVVGIIGNVVSFGLFLSPLDTFKKIYQKKSVEEFQYYPYLTAVIQCMLWVFYGTPFVTQTNTLVMTINGIGVAIELIYLFVFYFYDKQGKSRKQIAIFLVLELVFVAAVVVISMLAFEKLSTRALFVGCIADFFNICMYGAPLMIWRKVIKTKSVKYMPFWLSLIVFINSAIWFTYSLVIFDLFILISNGAGVLLGLIQLIIYGFFYRSTPKEDLESPAKKSPAELELSNQV